MLSILSLPKFCHLVKSYKRFTVWTYGTLITWPQILDSSKLNEFAYDDFKFMKMAESYPNG